MIETIAQIKTYFQTYDKPNQQQFINLIDTLATTVESFTRTLTQAEVRILYSASGGYGIELLPALTGGKIYNVSNPVLYWDITGGTVVVSDIWLYHKSDIANFIGGFQSIPELPLIPNTVIQLPKNNNGAKTLYPVLNNAYHIWSSVEQALFEGTLKIQFDYKIVTI